MLSETLIDIHDLLYARWGPQHWWPGESRIEIIVGAILTQNTNWRNVEKAIGNLKAAEMLSEQRLAEAGVDVLSALIRPAGYYNIKAARLKSFMKWLFDEPYCGRLEVVEQMSTDALREALLGVKGIGRETADSILLYAFGRCVFVVDAYTCRVMGRHGLIEAEAGYEQVRALLEDNLPADAVLFNEYHALLVQVGKEHCRPTARCAGCPLEHLPHDANWPAW
ncbi:MAG: endonuclease III domain-containing protein [Phycisphaerae bacterium]|nr:endonuclease III domain-containing protein [Phycisphaerae bacterium]